MRAMSEFQNRKSLMVWRVTPCAPKRSLSAKGALFNGSLRQRLRFSKPRTNSAEGAIHRCNPSSGLFQDRQLNRGFSA